MLRRDVMAAILMALLADPAFADLQGAPASAPVFTQDEMVVIERNETLSAVSKTDPWIVRRIFDALEQSQPDKNFPSAPSGRDDANPDLDQMQRASPEAAHDLFQLLKQAGEKKPEKQK